MRRMDEKEIAMNCMLLGDGMVGKTSLVKAYQSPETFNASRYSATVFDLTKGKFLI